MLHPKTKHAKWPSGMHKAVLAVNIHPIDIADQIGGEMNEGWTGGVPFCAVAFDIDGIGPVILEHRDDDPPDTAMFYVDGDVADAAAVAAIRGELALSPAAIVWSVMTTD